MPATVVSPRPGPRLMLHFSREESSGEQVCRVVSLFPDATMKESAILSCLHNTLQKHFGFPDLFTSHNRPAPDHVHHLQALPQNLGQGRGGSGTLGWKV